MYTRVDDFSLKDDEISSLSIEELMSLCHKYPKHIFRFWHTDYSPGELISWRGSYDTPCITYTSESVVGDSFLKVLQTYDSAHSGYKGGEYTFELDHSPYISQYGSSGNYTKIIGYEVHFDEVILLTQVIPY
jgi:hypothetical protein